MFDRDDLMITFVRREPAFARRNGLLNGSYSASAAEARLLQGHSHPGTLSARTNSAASATHPSLAAK